MPSISAEQLNQSLDLNLWPRFDFLERQDNVVTIKAFVPDHLEYFAGHFPEQPVLPGVVQVHWVGELAQKLFAVDGFSELKSIKFSSMILPNQAIELTLKYAQDKGTVRFSYQSLEAEEPLASEKPLARKELLKFSNGMLSFKVDDNIVVNESTKL